MPARLTAYVPDSAAVVGLLEDDTVYRIGRAAECELHIGHTSVSRFHAEIVGTAGLWRVHDTGSKNGLRVDGHLVLRADFEKSSWFSIGDVYCWIEVLDQAEVVLLRVVAGLGADEVGAIVGKSAGAVRVIQHRALKRLAALLATDLPSDL